MLLGVRTCAAAVVGLGLLGGLGCHSGGSYQLSWSFGDGQPASALTCADHGVFSIRITGASTQGGGDAVEVACAPGKVTRSVATGTWAFTVLGLDGQGHYRGDRLPAVVADGGADGGVDGEAGGEAAPDADAGVAADADADAADAADASELVDAQADADAETDAASVAEAGAEVGADAVAGADAGADADPLAAAADAVTMYLQATWSSVEIVSGKTTDGTVTLPPLPTCADGIDNNGDGRVDLDDPTCQGNPGASEGSVATGDPGASP